jgi:hypothetical protein
VRAAAALSLAGMVCGAVGGVIFWATNDGTPLTRAIAYGCWFAAAVALVAAAVSAQKLIWRRTNLPVLEGWVFVTASVVLTVAGAVIDTLGAA